MAIMKMLMMLVVAAILFCSHHQVTVAKEVATVVVDDENKSSLSSPFDILCQYWPWPYPWPQPCPPPRPRPRPRPRPCAPPPPPPCSPPPPPPPPPRSPPPRSPPPPPPKSPPPPPPRSPPPPPPKSPPPHPAPATTCSASDEEKVKTCMFNTTSIDACCPTFQSILGTSCPCYKYAEDLDNQVLITLEAYCDVSSPCKGAPPSPPPPPPKPSCSASDQQKVKTCMFNTTSIDACCPTFKSILGTSCPCYKYAEDLDNQVLITLESYCDVSSPCKGVQVI